MAPDVLLLRDGGQRQPAGKRRLTRRANRHIRLHRSYQTVGWPALVDHWSITRCQVSIYTPVGKTFSTSRHGPDRWSADILGLRHAPPFTRLLGRAHGR